MAWHQKTAITPEEVNYETSNYYLPCFAVLFRVDQAAWFAPGSCPTNKFIRDKWGNQLFAEAEDIR
jgi:hypothetical protein